MPNRPLTAAARERVVAALASGSKIEAIRLYRQDTLSSLAEAKAAVEAMAAGVWADVVGVQGVPATDAAVVAALYAGRKIEAIKQFRLGHRVDLRQAKEAVEAIEADLRRTTPDRFAAPPSSGGCGGRLIVAVVLLAAGALAVIAWLHQVR